MNAADAHLAVPGARLRLRDEGAGVPVVFVHGWTLDLDVFDPQVPLASCLRLVRYDRRGFGLSTGTPSLAQDVDDLRALIAALALTRPVLVGTSQGARVVLDFAARHPGLARALVLDGVPPCSQPDLPMAQFRATAQRDGIDAFRRLWAGHPMTRLVTADEAAHALLERVLARYPGADLLGAPTAAGGEVIDDAALARIRVPVLLVNGEHDLDSRRAAGPALRARLHAAEHVTIARAGHMPNLDAPREYNHIVGEFARRQLAAVA